MSTAARTKHEHDEASAASLTLHTAITGRTPAVPENTTEPVQIRLRPMDEQVRMAPAMAQELAATRTWRDDMGRRAPEAKDIADALLRDSVLEGTPFRHTKVGTEVTDARPNHATAMFKYCPTALVFGVWDSTGPKGGLGAKF